MLQGKSSSRLPLSRKAVAIRPLHAISLSAMLVQKHLPQLRAYPYNPAQTVVHGFTPLLITHQGGGVFVPRRSKVVLLVLFSGSLLRLLHFSTIFCFQFYPLLVGVDFFLKRSNSAGGGSINNGHGRRRLTRKADQMHPFGRTVAGHSHVQYCSLQSSVHHSRTCSTADRRYSWTVVQ